MIAQGYKKIISTLREEMGYDSPSDIQNMEESAERSAKGFLEIVKPIDDIKKELSNIVKKKFHTNYNGMVTVQNVIAYSFCPHHFLPVIYRITMGYIPKQTKQSYVMGLSKPARVAELLAGRPVLQETLAMDIANVLSSNFAERSQFPGINTEGCGVVVEGLHMCMACRGIKRHDSRAIMQKFHGIFLTEQIVRGEFMAIVMSNRPKTII